MRCRRWATPTCRNTSPGFPTELFFRKGVCGPWTHHVHMMARSDPGWERRLVFRDYLRAHPDAAEAYVTLKRKLAEACKDDIAA